MARPVRLEYEGAVYHVTSRGHERGRIFADDEDRIGYLGHLQRTVEEKQWIVHGYCLMTNHVHLLVETPKANVALGMQAQNGRYSAAYNRRHGRKGHLLEGRYHAIVVEKEPYLLELCRYIVLNPVRARIVGQAGGYPWSNYLATAGEAAKPSWLTTDWTLRQFGSRMAPARAAYRRFVAEGKGLPSPFLDVTGQVYLGGEAFLSDMKQKLGEMELSGSMPRDQREVEFVPLARIREVVAEEFGVSEESLRRNRGGAEKIAALYLSRRLSGLRGWEIGEAFGVTSGRVSHVARQVESGDRKALREVLGRLEAKLRSDA
jgi:REP element-mobilizing transposase RayT